MSDSPEVFRHEGFGRKVGPLPIWGWAIVLAAVAFIYVRFVSGKGSSASSGQASQAYPNVMTTGGYLPAESGSGSVAVGQAPAMFTDNTSWENAAIQGASQYGSDPVSLQQALDTYLHGGTLSSTQSSLIGRVISAIGAAPLGTQGTPTVAGSNPSSFTGFVRDPGGTIYALFSNNSASAYTDYNTFSTAAKSAGVSPSSYQNVSSDTAKGYTKLANNYQPGWSAPNA